MKVKGRVFKYGDNVDTDVIIPARYLTASGPEELARHCMEDINPSFVKKVNTGDIVVAGRNFGCGSSREHAPMAIKACGVSCLIARSFARIFYRNAVNIGLPILECGEAADNTKDGDEVEVDFKSGTVHNLTRNQTYHTRPFPEFIQAIIKADGLINYVRKSLAEDRNEWRR